MKVRVLGAHNLEVGHARHTCFLLDGIIAIDAGSLVTSLTAEEQLNIRTILLSHRHFDHVRDVPSLGLATLDQSETISLHSLPETLEAVSTRLMDGVLYPNLTKDLTGSGPKYRPLPVTPGEAFSVQGYEVRPIAVPHAAPTVGYVVHQPQGSSFAYCGDTGGGLLPFFEDPSRPDPLFIEITFSDRMEDRAQLTGHLTPNLFRREISEAAKKGLRIPRIMIVHRNLDHEAEIGEELPQMGLDLGIDVSFAQEGQTVDV